jgi:hypothetical protein
VPPPAPAGRPPVLLVVGEEGHDPWHSVLPETGPGLLSVLTSSPDSILMAAPEGAVRAARIYPPPVTVAAAAAASQGADAGVAPAAAR